MRKVKILPAKLLGKVQPTEPSDAPPPPSELVSLFVVGDESAGKTCLVRSFVYHESVSLPASAFTNDDEAVEDDKRKERNGDDGQSASTRTAVVSAKGITEKEWSVSYYKKDFLFVNANNCLRSLRVQLWDTSGIDPTTTCTSDRECLERAADWNVFWNKTAIIVLVISLAGATCEEIFTNIRKWKKWLDTQQQQGRQHGNANKDQQQKTVVLMLHQGDKLVGRDTSNTINTLQQQQQHPAIWMELGAKISHLCGQLQIKSWHITSSILEDDALGNSIDFSFRQMLGNRGKLYVSPTTSSRSSTPLSNGSSALPHSSPMIVAVATPSVKQTKEKKEGGAATFTFSPLT